jgi:NADH:ubiquinone oxidoreductase subunit 6 (subunit J)
MYDDNDELEAQVDRELRRLALPRAPHTLLPRVMAAVEAWAQRPWYTRAWFSWPAQWRVASLVPLVVFIYAVWSWNPPPAPPTLVAATDASRVVWGALIEPLLPFILLVVVLMGVVCAAVALALNYVLLERAEQR